MIFVSYVSLRHRQFNCFKCRLHSVCLTFSLLRYLILCLDSMSFARRLCSDFSSARRKNLGPGAHRFRVWCLCRAQVFGGRPAHLDCQPHNLLEAPPGRFIRILGSADPILQLHLEQEEQIFINSNDILINSNDIQDFYHLFRVSDERCRRNSLVATVAPWEVSEFKAFRKWMFGHEELCVGLACLAMGDTQAVELAQSCHLGICLQRSVIQEDSLVSMMRPPPSQKTMAGFVIDDFVSLSIESRSF